MPTYSYEAPFFVIEDYDRAAPFSSFLPGLAGRKGIPLWTFYVNRGQAIAGFGIRDKNSPIMEFSPASISYKNVSAGGFRTFVKIADTTSSSSRLSASSVYEPFHSFAAEPGVKRTLKIGRNELSLEEENPALGLVFRVVYFQVPGEDFAALARQIEIVNTGARPVELEALDGLPEILPYGTENAAYKEMGNLLRSWMDVFNLENGIPFYKLRSSTHDEAEVTEIAGGHFYLSFGGDGELIAPLVDAQTVFGGNTSLLYPERFAETPLAELFRLPQVTANKVPCGFTGKAARLEPGGSLRLHTLIGHAGDLGSLNQQKERLASAGYLVRKREEASRLADVLTDRMATSTSSPLFDAYCRQSYLDNLLRGGSPAVFGQGKEAKVYHLFSRKHGDLERDYNFFSIAPEFYSQGNGNFRDMNQNRRSDVFFHPEVGAFNVYMFFSLIQADGFNPLQVKGSTFIVPPDRMEELKALIRSKTAGMEEPSGPAKEAGERTGEHGEELAEALAEELAALCAKPFTPGGVAHLLYDRGVRMAEAEEEFLGRLLALSEQRIEAGFGEGYWIDHWTYNLDLIESYRAVYPDRMEELLHAPGTCLFFDSPVGVLPRSEKTVLKDGKVRQYGATWTDKEKMNRLGIGRDDTNWLRTDHGRGELYRTDLFVKLVALSLCKMASLDPCGMGIEMEAGKPGWNDAMNGLPGLFGSGMGETFELKRIVRFVAEWLETLRRKERLEQRTALLPEELYGFLAAVNEAIASSGEDDFACWSRLAEARERYREKIRFGIGGAEREITFADLLGVFRRFMQKLDRGIAKATAAGNGLVPTYFVYEAAAFEPELDAEGRPVIGGYGLPKAVVTAFRAEPLPAFLEGPVHALKTVESAEEAAAIYDAVRCSGLYDEKLRMYKTSVPLDGQPMEIGRIRAFTAGWLERESVFLHMSYKYLLELLKSGLTDRFYKEFRHGLIPFLDPAVYGRSTLENSSFLATSVNPDPAVHGRGYVARLSGSTAEFLSMWIAMMAGRELFRLSDDGELTFRLEPALPGWLFDGQGEIKFRLLGQVEVTYRNGRRADTFGAGAARVRRMTLTGRDGSVWTTEGGALTGDDARRLREGAVAAIVAELE
ncbi:cellobiose phosphorylase [Paenibacillus spiritus]|uniref:Cellobiose phosphorylase n=1 Tax=Paenibacillus spiritus TaxID=2496557 RepID=A0A5J5FZI1_9BACL|nr:cellobiose phosphorylase [Paenibacillus spiritus]KAA8999760.1 cellobiose phosphorylase [Paenibacillus spiritus]